MIRQLMLDQGVCATGDDTGRSIVYDYVDKERKQFFFSEKLDELLRSYAESHQRVEVDEESISFLLHHSFIPVGQSIVKNIGSLGVGDKLRVDSNGHLFATEQFPYFSTLSQQNSVPSTATLLGKLTAAVEGAVVSGRDTLLMLSSGKDSVSLALAYATSGAQNVRCLTFDNGTNNEESQYAQALCRRLGLQHETRRVPEDSRLVRDVLVSYFESTAVPCVDHVQIAYVLALSPYKGNLDMTVIDGMGNDIYLCHIAPSIRHSKKQNVIRPEMRRLRSLFPFTSRLDKLFQTRSELQFPVPLLRYYDTRKFYDAAVDTHDRLFAMERNLTHLDIFDFRTYIRGKQIDTGPAMQKGRNAAAFIGAEIAFPWADRELIDYCFNLPESNRFDRVAFKNKILVRQMLRDYIDYDETALPKRGFEFDGVRFIKANLPFVKEEILECGLWNKNIEYCLNNLLVIMEKFGKANYPILMLFMISGWYNHYFKNIQARR